MDLKSDVIRTFGYEKLPMLMDGRTEARTKYIVLHHVVYTVINLYIVLQLS